MRTNTTVVLTGASAQGMVLCDMALHVVASFFVARNCVAVHFVTRAVLFMLAPLTWTMQFGLEAQHGEGPAKL